MSVEILPHKLCLLPDSSDLLPFIIRLLPHSGWILTFIIHFLLLMGFIVRKKHLEIVEVIYEEGK